MHPQVKPNKQSPGCVIILPSATRTWQVLYSFAHHCKRTPKFRTSRETTLIPKHRQRCIKNPPRHPQLHSLCLQHFPFVHLLFRKEKERTFNNNMVYQTDEFPLDGNKERNIFNLVALLQCHRGHLCYSLVNSNYLLH